MVAQKKTKASKFLTVPTRPVPIDRDRSVAGLLEKMEGAGFGAKQLAEAHRIWLDMLDEDAILTSAFKARIPVYCPDIQNSPMSVGFARAKFEKKISIMFDLTQDTLEMLHIGQKTRNSAIITLGGAAGQSMVNLAEVTAYITRVNPRGHKYAISMNDGCAPLDIRTPSYAGVHTHQFGKLSRGATTAYVQCDPSIALPMIITALSQTAAKFMKGRKRPTFSFSGRDMHIEVP